MLRESLLVLDKKPGPTSFDIVREVKKIFPGTKVGHTGSLDPFASGVLILMTGRATKLSESLLNADKVYRAKIKLGEATDSMDLTGKVTESSPVPELTEELVREVLKSYEGIWNQVPPMFSAKKIKGVRLYKLARNNIQVRREPIPVKLHRLELLRLELPYLEFEVHCSKGTYVRALADDIGKRLKTVGHLHELRRLSCGTFTLKESLSLEEINSDKDRCSRLGYQNYVKFLRSENLARASRHGLPTAARNDNRIVR